MKILVTGGAGFIGSHAVEYYAKKGEEVIVLDSLSRAEIGWTPAISPELGVKKLVNWVSENKHLFIK